MIGIRISCKEILLELFVPIDLTSVSTDVGNDLTRNVRGSSFPIRSLRYPKHPHTRADHYNMLHLGKKQTSISSRDGDCPVCFQTIN